MDNASSIVLLPLRCPECGGDIGLGPRDRAFFCPRCVSLWDEEGGKLLKKQCVFGTTTQANPAYIPFWRFRLRAQTPFADISTYGQYLEHVSYAIPAAPVKEQELFLFVAAPSLLLEKQRLVISKQLTNSQPPVTAGEAKVGSIWGVALDEKTARRYAKAILVSTFSEAYKATAYFISHISVNLSRPHLAFIPFFDEGPSYHDSSGIFIIQKHLFDGEPVRFEP